MPGGFASAALEENEQERRRRTTHGIGPVTDLALLHALWQMPLGGQVDLGDLSEPDRTRVLASRGVVSIAGDTARRLYEPIGVVRSVALLGRSVERLLRRSLGLPPIYSRVVFLDGVAPDGRQLAEAREWGLGVFCARTLEPFCVPLEVASGRPHVYRWAIAEQVGASVYENTQPVS